MIHVFRINNINSPKTTTTMTSNEPPITPCSMTTPIANQLVDDVLNGLVSPQSITSPLANQLVDEALANANSFTSSSYSSDNTSAAEDEDDGQSTSRTTITKTTLKSDSFHSD